MARKFKLMVYYLYILKCCDNSLYTGITNDIEKRMKMHEQGKGSKYVRSRLPFEIVHTEKFIDKSRAMKRESEIKSMNRLAKLKHLGLSF